MTSAPRVPYAHPTTSPPHTGTTSRTESERWERRARELLQRIAAATARVTAIPELLRLVLDEVCAHTEWPVGHALSRTGDGPLRSTGIWHVDPPDGYTALREASSQVEFADGIGLPGRVAAKRQPCWIMDIHGDPNFPRARHGELDVRAAFGFPVLAGDTVVCVLEFFSPEAHEPDGPLLDVMATIGMLAGAVFERAAADAAMRASELRFRSVAETANDGIISVDEHGHIVFWNERAEAIFGWREGEMLGRSLTGIMPERHRTAHQRGLERVARGGERRVIGRTVELHGLRRDGTEMPIELSLASWQQGGATFFTGIVRDISERKRAEEELRRFAARLEESERRAQEASRAKSAFLANMSHELRTPLNAILGFVQLMRRDDSLQPVQRQNLDIVLHSGEHLLGLINDVLSIAKIEAGHVSLNETDHDLDALVAGLGGLFQPRARTKGLSLLVEKSGELPRVRGDEAKLRQVLINLLSNAIKFTSQGGVALRAAWHDGRASFEVEDSGRGIGADELDQIFEPFVQAGETSGSGGEGGTGLGLAISRSFLRAMGGELTVRSTVDKGTCFAFSVNLPRASGDGRAVPERHIVALAPGQAPARILVVDNDGDNRLLLLRLLGLVGYDVRVAEDGEAALEAWSQFRPELVLMDMRMPVMDGYEATRRLRALEQQRGLPRAVVIALTASAFDHDRPEILAAGCDEIIAKPFREGVLLEEVAAKIGRHYLYEAPASAPPAAMGAAALETRLGALPDDERAALHRVLALGDDLAAGEAATRILAADPDTRDEVLRMIRGFQLDELLAVLEGLTP